MKKVVALLTLVLLTTTSSLAQENLIADVWQCNSRAKLKGGSRNQLTRIIFAAGEPSESLDATALSALDACNQRRQNIPGVWRGKCKVSSCANLSE